MSLQDILATIALVAGALAVPAALSAYRSSRRDRRRDDFRKQLSTLPVDYRKLATQALEGSPDEWRFGGIPMWSRPGWIPESPYDIDEIALQWSPVAMPEERIESAKRYAGRIFAPLRLAGRPGYSGAVTEVAGMSKLFDGTIYRPVEIDLSGNSRRIAFTAGSYFDYLDTSEVLAFEAHARERASRFKATGRSYRSRLRDPFDLRNRVASLGIDTLTIRVDSSRAGFFLHKRDPEAVVNNSSQLGVIPAGEFTPSDVTQEAIFSDLDLWRNIMREFAEEFLGAEEAQGRGGSWINYDDDEPYRLLNEGRSNGEIRVRVLGLGVDPVAWKPELLTVCILEAARFDAIFSAMLARNEEGLVVQGQGGRGLPFDQATVNRYINAENISPNAKSCLQLAWKHRSSLGLEF